MKYFYKQNQDGSFTLGSGYIVPQGFTEYIKGQEPLELRQWLDKQKFDNAKQSKIKELKDKRDSLVDQIIVTISTGESLNGDEASQTRMTRAISALPDDTTTIDWIDANNAAVVLTKPKLLEALTLAGQEQTKIFATYNQYRQQVLSATTVEDIEAIAW